ncbi:hypothetical protein [Sanguibacter suaedae]|uniref:Uncharacterized protein n=1 Tax=Sanguibacter suaedae TaxID=2795737 RepID=A0A934I9M1_9MICO|nr:hypothetical protein [Sanguibacter suaedae]MBI9113760.1 hypothetical protein [Sanguibacter suaedae]
MLTAALIVAYGACAGILLAYCDGRDVPSAVTVAFRVMYLITIVALAWAEWVSIPMVFLMIAVMGIVAFAYGPWVWTDHPAMAEQGYLRRAWVAQRHRKHLRTRDTPLPGQVHRT